MSIAQADALADRTALTRNYPWVLIGLLWPVSYTHLTLPTILRV